MTTHPYCLLALPPSYHHQTDWMLAGILMSGPLFLTDWVNQINPYLAFAGGTIGLFIAVIRVYELLKGFFTKPQQVSDIEVHHDLENLQEQTASKHRVPNKGSDKKPGENHERPRRSKNRSN